MHRNDWLPVAKVRVSKGLEPDVDGSMCFGKVEHYDTVEALKDRVGGTAILDRLLPPWRELRFPNVKRVLWFSPCAFVKGHPGECGEKLPDIFLPDGRVKPQIERLLKNRRKTHGTLDPAPDAGPDGAGAAGRGGSPRPTGRNAGQDRLRRPGPTQGGTTA